MGQVDFHDAVHKTHRQVSKPGLKVTQKEKDNETTSRLAYLIESRVRNVLLFIFVFNPSDILDSYFPHGIVLKIPSFHYG